MITRYNETPTELQEQPSFGAPFSLMVQTKIESKRTTGHKIVAPSPSVVDLEKSLAPPALSRQTDVEPSPTEGQDDRLFLP